LPRIFGREVDRPGTRHAGARPARARPTRPRNSQGPPGCADDTRRDRATGLLDPGNAWSNAQRDHGRSRDENDTRAHQSTQHSICGEIRRGAGAKPNVHWARAPESAMDATIAPEARAFLRLENIMVVNGNDVKWNVKSVRRVSDGKVPNDLFGSAGRGWRGKILNSSHNHVRPLTTSPSRPPIPSRQKSSTTSTQSEVIPCNKTIQVYTSIHRQPVDCRINNASHQTAGVHVTTAPCTFQRICPLPRSRIGMPSPKKQ